MFLLLITFIFAACIEQSCIYGNSDGNGNVIITIHSSNSAWAGIGVGQSMSSATMVIGFKNGNSYTLSDRTSRSRSLPSPQDPYSQLVPLAVPAPSWARIAFSFRAPMNRLGITAGSSYIFASGTGVSNPSDPRSSFSYHGVDHRFGVRDFTVPLRAAAPNPAPPASNPAPNPAPPVSNQAPASPNPAPEAPSPAGGTASPANRNSDPTEQPPESPSPTSLADTAAHEPTKPILALPSSISYLVVVQAHGVILIFSWLLAPLLGIYVARFMKNSLGLWWYRIHVLIMLIGVGVFSITGILLVYLYTSSPHFSTADSFHPLLGLLVTILMFFQFVLGFVCDYMFDEDRRSIPWWDKLHWWVGRLSVILGAATIVLGILYYQMMSEESVVFLYSLAGVFLLIGLGANIFGQFRIGATHHVSASISAKKKY